MREKIKATEEMHLEKEWFKEASKTQTKNVNKFIEHVFRDYNHDYGMVVHAVSAAALAAAWAGASELGITGFQASLVMWDFIQQWTHIGKEVGARVLNFDNMLYPQYEYKYEKTIDQKTWENLQKAAKKNLEETTDARPDVIKHWQSIVDGHVPFGYVVKKED